jgi:hypothetical protein
MRSALAFVAALSLACAKQQVPPVAQLSPEREARCRAVSDSIFANVPPEQLPTTRPLKGRPPRVGLRVPESVPVMVPVRIAFLVRPDGTADTMTVAITGTEDSRFKRDAMKLVSHVTHTPAEIDGCPVWSREAIVVVRTGIVRERSVGPSNPRARP